MGKLNYKPNLANSEMSYKDRFLKVRRYNVSSLYDYPNIHGAFTDLRTNVADLNAALVTKAVQGTEQDFIVLMDKASEYINVHFGSDKAESVILLDLFQECIFGYYVLTPLIKATDVSDIKVLDWNKITCKANGVRYLTNISFFSESDYENWFDRIMRIHHLPMRDEKCLQFCTDVKGVDDYFLRIDIQLKKVTSTQKYNIHIRKVPKEKYSWDYLKNANMLDDEIIQYFADRVASGYSFILAGKGGSGKTAVLNRLIDLIPLSESAIVAQESDELYSELNPHMQFEHTLHFENINGEKIIVTLEDILELALLQDIDNIIVGEVKGGEALYVFTTAASTGARFMLSLHSNNAKGAVRRLIQCAKFVSDYSIETLEEMLSSVPVAIVHFKGFCVNEILEVEGWDEEAQHLNYHEVYKKKFGVK